MKRYFLPLLFLFFTLPVTAQYNIKKMMEEGRKTLNEGFYVASMQIFSRIVALKPNLYEAWYLMGVSKYHLEDYEGAGQDCAEAIKLNPYVAELFDLRAMARIREEQFDSASVDYTHAIELQPDNRDYWFNRAYCIYRGGNRQLALQQLDYITDRWSNFPEARALRKEIKNGKRKASSDSQLRWIDSRRKRFVVGRENWKL